MPPTVVVRWTENGILIDRCEQFVIELLLGWQISKADDLMGEWESFAPTNYGTILWNVKDFRGEPHAQSKLFAY